MGNMRGKLVNTAAMEKWMAGAGKPKISAKLRTSLEHARESPLLRTTPPHRGQWKPGQSGNPAGRKKGSRHKLGAEFIDAIYEDFLVHGRGVIEVVRNEKPAVYLQVVAKMLPAQVEIKEGGVFSEMSDSEIDEYIADTIRRIQTRRKTDAG